MKKALEEQAILGTGASGEIGAAIFMKLAEEGARPIIHYGRDKVRAEELLAGFGGKGWVIRATCLRPKDPFSSGRRPSRRLDVYTDWSTTRVGVSRWGVA
jgi:NAD(P)-dependent dehydrogenase (short-subunit alcohol dehydrogenase family)